MTYDYEGELESALALREHLLAHGDLCERLVDGLLDRGDEVRVALAQTPRWRLIRRHRLTGKLLQLDDELQSIERNMILVEGHVKEHMREMGLVK